MAVYVKQQPQRCLQQPVLRIRGKGTAALVPLHTHTRLLNRTGFTGAGVAAGLGIMLQSAYSWLGFHAVMCFPAGRAINHIINDIIITQYA